MKSNAELRLLVDRFFDRRLGIQSSAAARSNGESSTLFGDVGRYESPLYVYLYWFLAHVPTTPEDVFWDVGCGCGRALCIMARRKIRKCVGVELIPGLAMRARANAESLRARRCPIEVRIGDAALEDYGGGTFYYLCNPFGAQTLRAVLDRVRQTLLVDPRYLRFLYVNPVHDDVFASAGWLKLSSHCSFPLSRSIAQCWESAR